jgi:hypothetical protein
MARLKHYRFGFDVAVGYKLQLTFHFWRWSWSSP